MSEDPAKTGILYTDHSSGSLRARRYRVVVVTGPDAGAGSEIDNGTFLVGTHPNTDLKLTDKGVSRYHLELQLRSDGLKVTDLDSTNGTFQGTTRVGSVVLSGAAKLKLGSNTEIEIAPADIPVAVEGYAEENFGAAIGGSRYMKELFGLLDRVAATEATVLLEGETGTGKELLAEALHQRSQRRNGPFVVVDCGALPRDLIGSELFGHVRGAFTGALNSKKGLIEEADGGTLFLDEVGELPLDLQPQLLRALEKREVRPIGEVRARKVNIRVIAATNRNLAEQVRGGTFREDLYFRLAVVRANVPALRKHKEDIPLLVRNFLRDLKREDFELSPDILAQLMAHDWPGNVRELRNVVERGLSLEGGALPIEVSSGVQAGIADLANSNFTGRGVWSILSQPAGASAALDGGTVYIFVSIRANVTNMTVPGDYVFQLIVTNPVPPNLTNQIICTVHPASSPPVIGSITATPGSVTLPTNALQLLAVTSGSASQPLRHWWAVKTAPAGAKPQFDHQGATNTTVGNLNLPGNYTFTLRAFDDLHMTTQDKTITVSAAPGAPVITSAAAASVIVGTPFTYTITATASPVGFNATNLPPGLTFSNGVISGVPLIVGTYNVQLGAINASGAGYGNLALTAKLPLPVITSSATADGFTNVPFTTTIQAANVPTSFSAIGLPAGLILNSLTGIITGTPTNAGIFVSIRGGA